MKTRLIIYLLLYLPLIVKGQESYYYYKGEKVYLNIDHQNLNVQFESESAKENISALRSINLQLDDSKSLDGKYAKFQFQSVPKMQEYTKTVEILKKTDNVANVFPFFKNSENNSLGTSDIFYVKLKNKGDSTLLFNIAKNKNVEVIKQILYMPEWYILSFKKSSFQNSLEASSYFYETEKFEDTDPAFMFDFKIECVDDPMFNQQWGLKNTSYPGIDINICEAWNISKGAGVNVAVVDQGIQKTHPDLSSNIHPLSFNAENGTSPSIFNEYEHATHVAGIIAAVENNNQIVGVAPQAKLMDINHHLRSSYSIYIAAELASGISWAWQNGADIINNSWGGYGNDMRDSRSIVLEEAIINAMTLGRNGKGCIVIFCSGNHYSIVGYPATFHDNILTVGAIDPAGNRSSFSNYGAYDDGDRRGYGVDVVAPGRNILSTMPNNTTALKSGTSMAAPHVAGIAALMLSVNPDLTGQQVRDIIESTAKKTGGYNYSTVNGRTNGTWHEEVGYGLVDAYEAVRKAAVYDIKDKRFGANASLFVFTCNKEIIAQNIILENGSELQAASGKRITLLPSFHAKEGSFVHLISEVDWLYEYGFDCDDEIPVHNYGDNSQYQLRNSINIQEESKIQTNNEIINTKKDDPVVETIYYNLQGTIVSEAVVEGFYIKKNIHSSQKVTIEKIYIKKN